MTESVDPNASRVALPAAILFVILVYAVSLALGWPQYGTRAIVGQQAHHDAAASDKSDVHADHAVHEAPALWMIFPFLAMLGAIAVLPLIPPTHHWWESNRNKLIVALSLAISTLASYAMFHHSPIEGHWPAHHVVTPTGGFQLDLVRTILENAIMQEFIPFIVLLFSLYTISGGIRIEGDLNADPLTNAAFMAVGAVLARVIGTTGAAMLLVRPLLNTNRQRKHVAHTIVFFIFTVCNCGGCLLPLGDPPLFLGYLEGVSFLWTLRLWKEWAFVNTLLILTYVLLDRLVFYRRETMADVERDLERVHRLRFAGWQLNVPLLLGVVLAVALLDPSKPLIGTDWHAWMYLRELVQLSLVVISLWLGNQQTRDKNQFNYSAILEVGALFIGIFICMQPALQYLAVNGHKLGVDSPAEYFWATGGLSSVLDNAPTYLVFFKTAQAMPAPTGATLEAGVEESFLVAISLGAVFMGAMTYIGNGPNFMVKAIAEESGVTMPSFFAYMIYSFAVLLPILALMVWQFLT